MVAVGKGTKWEKMANLTPLKTVVFIEDEARSDDETMVKQVYDVNCDDFVSSQTYSQQYDGAYQGQYYTQESFRCESGRPAVTKSEPVGHDDSLTDLLLDDANVDVFCGDRFTKLTSLARQMPKDMFVNKLLTSCGSSEATLETIRSQMFEVVKDADDFPYGLQVELKRRVRTRAGDSISTKLARDVHCLTTVQDGGDYSDLTELMSLPRINRSSRSQQNSTIVTSEHKCECSAELKQPKDDIAHIRADVIS